MFPYPEISLVSRRFFGRDDGQTSRISPSLLCPPVLCAFPSLHFQRFTPKFPGHRGSPTLSISHMIQGVATKTKKRAIIVFCDASGAACTGSATPGTTHGPVASGIQGWSCHRIKLWQDHPAAQTRIAWMQPEALI